MKKNNKKGFTIVELVIVIAVIAILAAVLIPTFSSIIKKAKQTSDIQAVQQMNTALAIDGAVTPTSIAGFYDALEEVGFTAKDYKPLYSDRCFYWVKSLNTVIYYDRATNKIIYPEGVSVTTGWFALDGSFDTREATITELPNADNNTYSFTVTNAADFVKVAEITSANESTLTNNKIVIELTCDIDLQGADVNFATNNSVNVEIKSNDDNTPRTISGLYVSDKHTHEGFDSTGNLSNNYGHSLFNKVGTLTVKNITIKDSVIGGYGASQAGFFAAIVTGEAEFTNVTIENCVVQGERKVGVLVGFFTNGASVKFNNVKIKNCSVSSLQGEAGVLFGVYTDLDRVSETRPFNVNKVSIENSSVSIYSNKVLTARDGGKEYKVVEYEENGTTKYRVATANIGFIGKTQSQEPESLNGGTVKVVLYKAINDLTELSTVRN